MIEDHCVYVPYREMRAAIIREAAPELEEPVIQQIARGTFGMVREEILQQIARYRSTGELPNSYYQKGACPRNPESGAVMERLFNPADLAKQIEDLGFHAHYYAYFGGAGGNPIVRLINTIGIALTPITIRWARAFRVVATRS
jgi:hypothetical protein